MYRAECGKDYIYPMPRLCQNSSARCILFSVGEASGASRVAIGEAVPSRLSVIIEAKPNARRDYIWICPSRQSSNRRLRFTLFLNA
jgi:hypothetical protein